MQYVWVGVGASGDVQVGDPVVLLYTGDEVTMGTTNVPKMKLISYINWK